MQKILVIDHDETVAASLRNMLESQGHNVIVEPMSDETVFALRGRDFDILLLGLEAGQDVQQLIRDIRRNAGHYIYVQLMGEDMSEEQALQLGANNFLPKPVDQAALNKSIEAAILLRSLLQRIGDDKEDFPSAGGVIAKSAFNQLFLSVADCANRYGEQTYTLFISINNYREIFEMDGAYAADYAVAMLSQQLVKMRRRSDIIGQTAKYEYALLLQGPLAGVPPADAAKEAAERFTKALAGCGHITSSGGYSVEITVSLVAVPSGVNLVKNTFSPGTSRIDHQE